MPSPFASLHGEVSWHWEERKELLRKWASDPLEFIYGQDIDGRYIIRTKDEADPDSPYKPFPRLEYIEQFIRHLYSPQLFCECAKSRQMMVSTQCCACLLWEGMFHRARKMFISKTKESQAIMLMNDKIRGTYKRMPKWLQDACPMTMKPANRCYFPDMDSEIIAVAENAAVAEFRGNTPTHVLIDEAAFQPFFPDMLRAVQPIPGCRVWAVSTADSGNPGADLFQEKFYEQ